ncbi:MAG: 30S ribosomal protein S20 [Spirochaetales bacterium]|nr:30S ribosomal protein S20 [Spirochaetales bacterium]
MANIKSAEKDIRRTARRNERNSSQRTRLRTFNKKVLSLVAAGKLDEARTAYQTMSSLLDRAGKTGLIHHRQADRKKSRLAKLIHKAGNTKS